MLICQTNPNFWIIPLHSVKKSKQRQLAVIVSTIFYTFLSYFLYVKTIPDTQNEISDGMSTNIGTICGILGYTFMYDD